MKKRIIVVLSLILVVICSIFAVHLYIQKQNEQKQILEEKKIEERLSYINSELSPFKEGKEIIDFDKKDAVVVEFLNKFILNNNIVDNINLDNYINITNINDLDSLKNTLNKTSDSLKNIEYDDNIEHIVKGYSKRERDLFINSFKESSIYSSIEEYKNKINSIQEQISLYENAINFLQTNKDKYNVINNKIIYTDDNFKSEFNKYNLNITLEKKIDYGKKIPILMYHGVLDNAWGQTDLFVRVSEFDAQMKYLSENGYTAIYAKDYLTAPNYEKPIIITFDDGYMDNYTNAYPILKKYNIKASMYIISGWLDGQTYMNPDMVKELSDSGIIEIGSHTVTHISLGGYSYDKVLEELSNSKTYLENLIGKEVSTIAYPKGSYNNTVTQVAKNYYKFGLTTNKDFNYEKKYSSYALNRIKIARGCSLDTFKSLIN